MFMSDWNMHIYSMYYSIAYACCICALGESWHHGFFRMHLLFSLFTIKSDTIIVMRPSFLRMSQAEQNGIRWCNHVIQIPIWFLFLHRQQQSCTFYIGSYGLWLLTSVHLWSISPMILLMSFKLIVGLVDFVVCSISS